jgi:hypothetical protein
MNWKGFGRKQWPKRDDIPECPWGDWQIPRNTSVRKLLIPFIFRVEEKMKAVCSSETFVST